MIQAFMQELQPISSSSEQGRDTCYPPSQFCVQLRSSLATLKFVRHQVEELIHWKVSDFKSSKNSTNLRQRILKFTKSNISNQFHSLPGKQPFRDTRVNNQHQREALPVSTKVPNLGWAVWSPELDRGVQNELHSQGACNPLKAAEKAAVAEYN